MFIGGRDATGLPPRRRKIAMVFQSYAVFPHLKLYDNIAFGLRMQKESKATIRERVESAANLLHIEELLDRYPSQISGGQRQRVAVARAIATKADVLLMDEPLSNLDALLRMEMRAELKALLRQLGSTTIYVTHDQVEALSMGDRIAVMNAGRIVQLDSPLVVYDDPADTFVGGFVGTPPMNFLAAEIAPNGSFPLVTLSGGSFPLADPAAGALAGRKLTLGIRAEAIVVEPDIGEGLIEATVIVIEPLGSHNLLTVKTGDDLLKVSTPPHLFPQLDSSIWLRLEPGRIRWMDAESGRAIPLSDPRRAARRRVSDLHERGGLLAARRPRLPPGLSRRVRARKSASSAAAGSRRTGICPAYAARTASTSSASTIASPRRRSASETRFPSSGASSQASTSCWHDPRDRHRRHRDRSRGPPRAHRAGRRGREARARTEAACARRRRCARSRRGGRAPRVRRRREPERALVAARGASRRCWSDDGAIGDVIAVTHLLDRPLPPLVGTHFEEIEHFTIFDYFVHWIDISRCWLDGKTVAGVRAHEYRPPHEPAGSADAVGRLGRDRLRGRRERDDPRRRRRADETAVVSVLDPRDRGHDSRQRPPRLRLRRARTRRSHVDVRPRGRVVPDGFAGTLAELASAIVEDREPFNSARHNLLSLAITLAACRSAEEGSRLVSLDELGT